MPMLQLTQEEKPIIWQPFKCPRGQALEGLGKRRGGVRVVCAPAAAGLAGGFAGGPGFWDKERMDTGLAGEWGDELL